MLPPLGEIQAIVSLALNEDLGGLSPQEGDITAKLLPENKITSATIISRQEAVFCGKVWANEAFLQVDPEIIVTWLVDDGCVLQKNEVICELQGPAKSLLTAERTAMNFIQTLSGTATVTKQYVDRISDTGVKLLDTRKTIPGLRLAQKYAVTCGGGLNHRLGLYDAFLIKENHIIAYGSIQKAIEAARSLAPNKKVEVEVESIEELKSALAASPDIIMLDNFKEEMMKEAVQLNQNKVKLEISGNVTLDTIATYAKTGIDYISVGALTKHVTAIDLSMRLTVL